MLENEGYAATFGSPSDDPYLASTLPAAGALLTNYYGIGHHSNDNYIAMISGQAPNPAHPVGLSSSSSTSRPRPRWRPTARSPTRDASTPTIGPHGGQPADATPI